MTKRSRWAARLAAAVVLMLPSVAPLRADETSPPPYRSIRVLNHLQEQVTHGDKAAHAALPALLETIGTRFLDAEPGVWRDPRNARAAILYLFSGGRPMVVRTVLSRSTMPHAMDRLLKGALAYAEGQDQIARDLLDPIDARTIMPVVGGQLALVQATLFATVDPKKARHFLDLARLLVPGSLVEEAALRQQITLETDPASLDKFIALSRQYLHRYQASIYAQNFKQHFAAAAIKIGADGDIEQIAKLEKAIAELPPAQARAVYLAMSRAAIVAGKLPAARYAAGDAAILAKGAPQDAARATLYMNASSAAEDDAGHSMAGLESADKAHLSPQDAELRDAALAIARSSPGPRSPSLSPPRRRRRTGRPPRRRTSSMRPDGCWRAAANSSIRRSRSMTSPLASSIPGPVADAKRYGSLAGTGATGDPDAFAQTLASMSSGTGGDGAKTGTQAATAPSTTDVPKKASRPGVTDETSAADALIALAQAAQGASGTTDDKSAGPAVRPSDPAAGANATGNTGVPAVGVGPVIGAPSIASTTAAAAPQPAATPSADAMAAPATGVGAAGQPVSDTSSALVAATPGSGRASPVPMASGSARTGAGAASPGVPASGPIGPPAAVSGGGQGDAGTASRDGRGGSGQGDGQAATPSAAGQTGAASEATTAVEAAPANAMAGPPTATGQVLQMLARMGLDGDGVSAGSSQGSAAPAAAPEAAPTKPAGTPSTLTLELSPANLGRVTVTLRQRGDQLDIRIAVASKDTLTTLGRDRHQLEAAIGSARGVLDLVLGAPDPVSGAPSGTTPSGGAAVDTGAAPRGDSQGSRRGDQTTSQGDQDGQGAATAGTKADRSDGSLYL